MTIERSTAGLIDLHFRYLEEIDGEKMKLADKVNLVSTLTKEIRGIASIELAHKKFQAQAPELAKESHALKLVHNSSEG